MKILEVNEDNFNTIISNSKGILIVDFFASWCKPCTVMAPIIEEAANRHEEVKFVKVDIDKEMHLAEIYKIDAVPTIIKFLGGKELRRSVGTISINELEEIIDN